VLDSENVLIDGRNRLEACHRAGVGPTFEQINGVDFVAFILSSNGKRRHMIKGARAEEPPGYGAGARNALDDGTHL
jgi:hypothetical protein